MAVGDVIVAASTFLGLSVVAAMYPALLEIIRYGGAAYLAILGLEAIRGSSREGGGTEERSLGRIMVAGGIIALTNPKAILLHASVLPALLVSGGGSLQMGLVALALVLVVNLIVMSFYSALTSLMRGASASARRISIFRRLSGGCMISCAMYLLIR